MKRTSTQDFHTRAEKSYHDLIRSQLAVHPDLQTQRAGESFLADCGDDTPYASPCPLIHALNIIGGKWKLPILWHLYGQGTVRYNALRRMLKGVTNMMLSKCLKELEADGLVARTQYPEMPPRVEYSLTERADALLPALKALHEWGREQQGR